MTSVAARLCAGGTTEALLRSRKGPLAWSGAKGLEPLTVCLQSVWATVAGRCLCWCGCSRALQAMQKSAVVAASSCCNWQHPDRWRAAVSL